MFLLLEIFWAKLIKRNPLFYDIGLIIVYNFQSLVLWFEKKITKNITSIYKLFNIQNSI